MCVSIIQTGSGEKWLRPGPVHSSYTVDHPGWQNWSHKAWVRGYPPTRVGLFFSQINTGKLSLLENLNDLWRISGVRYESKHLYQLLVHRHFPLKHMGSTRQRGAIGWDSGMVKASLGLLDIERWQEETRPVPSWILTKNLLRKNIRKLQWRQQLKAKEQVKVEENLTGG